MKIPKAIKLLVITIAMVLLFSPKAFAHISEQGIVLLLPTNIYIVSGCLAVIASMLLVAFLPHEKVFALFKTASIPVPRVKFFPPTQGVKDGVSIAVLLIIIGLITVGALGSRDPLVNLLPLSVWTFWWIILFMAHGILGNIWGWINPWTGLYNWLFGTSKPMFELPSRLGVWPAIVVFIAFYIFIIADLAPDDPARLANIVLAYLVLTFTGMIVFGAQSWLSQVECFSILFALLARLAPVRFDKTHNRMVIGLPGWQALALEKMHFSKAFFILSMLACGSFDGMNETFWWLVQIGINPLAFPGRSAVFTQSVFGMLASNILLYGIFTCCIFLGVKLTLKSPVPTPGFKPMFSGLTLSLLPIISAYHGAHYFTSLMLNSQYLIAALSDPLANGSNYLGLENFQVTTGYLNEIASVQKIWLTQAAIVVFGHIIAVLMAHFIIAKHINTRKQAIIFHIPIAFFMAGYTWFGLWLLAAPKGA